MTYSVYQHWDPLKVCIVGKTYDPKIYKNIKNYKIRSLLEKIAYETDEDFNKLINLLESFNVQILRPNTDIDFDINENGKNLISPPVQPRDFGIMLGNKFFWNFLNYDGFRPNLINDVWHDIKGIDWPDICPDNFHTLSKKIKIEIKKNTNIDINIFKNFGFDQSLIDKFYEGTINHIKNNSIVYNTGPEEFHMFNSAMITRIGKDIFVGTIYKNENLNNKLKSYKQHFPHYRWHAVDTGGHSDGTFCPVVPGLVISSADITDYSKLLPDWEVVYLKNQNWDKLSKYFNIKSKFTNKWHVKGIELNQDFINFVDSYLTTWTGNISETIFDINVLMIDKKNVVCSGYNKKLFQVFNKYGITPHIINFRHKLFYDCGIHCITNDIHRDGVMQDYFPERG